MARQRIRIAPLTLESWPDLERLFGSRGACGGCWCMYWRLPRAAFEARKGAGNRRALRALVAAGEVPGLIAYAGDEPVGWCAVGPRAVYPRLATSRNLRPPDAIPVWSVPCFFVSKAWRRRGLTARLLGAAAAFARAQGAPFLEGYPIESGRGEVPAPFAWTGFAAAFRQAGFVEVARRSPRQAVFRKRLGKAARPRSLRPAGALASGRKPGGGTS